MLSGKKTYMRCVAFCTASAYDLGALANAFKRKNYYVQHSRDVVHVVGIKNGADIYFFSHGSFVCWGLKKPQEQKLVQRVKEFEIKPLTAVQTDHFCFRLGEDTSIDSHERFKIDVITLDSDNPQIKLAISYGLAQSIKLETFEEAIQVSIKKNNHLPEEIARRGMISVSRTALFQRIGEIFIARSSINLNSEYLDTPEFFLP